jgi:hypothetical protein
MRIKTAPNNTVCTVPQSARYHKLPTPIVLRPASSQARLHGVLGRKSMYVGQWETAIGKKQRARENRRRLQAIRKAAKRDRTR